MILMDMYVAYGAKVYTKTSMHVLLFEKIMSEHVKASIFGLVYL
jgi:hypothetical protein